MSIEELAWTKARVKYSHVIVNVSIFMYEFIKRHYDDHLGHESWVELS